MPDTFTHIALPALFSRYFTSPLNAALLLIGTVLPDYFREFFSFILPKDYYSMTYPFHSLSGIIFVSLLLSALFITAQRQSVFLSLLTGQTLHLLFDLTQSYGCSGSLTFFPLWQTFQLNLISETHWLYIFIFSASVFTLHQVLVFIKEKRTRKTTHSS
ncbi:MAG: hypothetical protein E4H13_02020 [Calditrichales bacterium]|nr:MAG: hypothetical protein E4H13_02020 [Calditrichales bacterium]